MKLKVAQKLAEKIVAELGPYCERIEVAGLVRRKDPEPGDLEIVCLRRGRDLINFVGLVNSWKKSKGEPTGRYTQRYVPLGGMEYVVDIFIPQRHDYIRQFVIRTGSAEFVKNKIASKWVANGWRGTEDGLRLDLECVSQNGTWKCIADEPTLPPVWQTEEEFFQWLGIPYVLPENRK